MYVCMYVDTLAITALCFCISVAINRHKAKVANIYRKDAISQNPEISGLCFRNFGINWLENLFV